MINRTTKIIIFIFFILLSESCVVSKNIEGDKLILKSNEITINGNLISKDSLQPLLNQNKNSYIFGIPFSSFLYESSKKNSDTIFNKWLNKKSKRKKRLTKLISEKQVSQIKQYIKSFNEWKKRNGEELQLIDSTKTKMSIENLKSFFKNNGYFDAKINSSVEINKKNKRYGKVLYNIELGNQYYLDSIKFNIESKLLDSIYVNNLSNSFLKKNNPFNTLDFESERNRLDKLFKNTGIYNFQINSISFQVSRDTTGTDLRVPVKINIDENTTYANDSKNLNKYRIHYISRINVFTNNILSLNKDDLEKPTIFKNINIYSKGKLRYKPKSLTNLIAFEEGDNYNEIFRSKTIKQLNNLQNFQYPSISYNYLKNSEDQLEANILLNPKERFSIGFGFDLKHSNIEDIGIAFETSFISRNVFQGSERLEISSRGTFGKSGNTTISEYGVDFKLNFPKLFIPIKPNKFIPVEPNTYIVLGTSKQTNIGLDRQTLKFNLNYEWKNKKDHKVNFGLLNIELVDNKNSFNYFNIYSNSFNTINNIALKSNANSSYFGSLNKLIIPSGINSFINDVTEKNLILDIKDFNTVNYINDRRNRLTSNNLIISSSFSKILNNGKNEFNRSFSQFRYKIEVAGTLTNFLAKQFNATKDQFENRKILDLTYSQYFKSEINYIKHWPITSNSIIAIRGYFGIAVPFGNSDNIPFSKSFFSGGSNDNRAWEVYRLGPGSSGANSEFNEANMKLAFNVEYRFGLIGKLDGAIFTDFGNIWNVYDNTNDPKRTFNNFKDLNEIAIGSGFGLRYNLGYFVLRLDMGLKTYNPALDVNERWLTDFKLKKAVFNIGLNYPF